MSTNAQKGIFIRDPDISPSWEEISLADLATLLSVGSSSSYGEVPSGSINGVNTVFILQHVPLSGRLRVYLNGARLKATDDYSLSSLTITFVSAPLTGSNILCDYDY